MSSVLPAFSWSGLSDMPHLPREAGGSDQLHVTMENVCFDEQADGASPTLW